MMDIFEKIINGFRPYFRNTAPLLMLIWFNTPCSLIFIGKLEQNSHLVLAYFWWNEYTDSYHHPPLSTQLVVACHPYDNLHRQDLQWRLKGYL